jgi:serine/threonine protein kinase
VQGKEGDSRSDIYALGVMLYEMLTGEVPFTGPNAFVIMNERLVSNPVPPREIDSRICPQIQEIVYRAMERDPENRYANADQMIWDLEHHNEVGAAERTELHDWSRKHEPVSRLALFYAILALIPIVIFTALLWVARH